MPYGCAVADQTDPDRTAVHALRSLLWLQDRTAALAPEGWRGDLATLTETKPPTGFDFVELEPEGARGNPTQDLVLLRKAPSASA